MITPTKICRRDSDVTAREARVANGSTTPVIDITAQDKPGMRERALRSGCYAYLPKSEPGEALLGAIAEAIQPLPNVDTRME